MKTTRFSPVAGADTDAFSALVAAEIRPVFQDLLCTVQFGLDLIFWCYRRRRLGISCTRQQQSGNSKPHNCPNFIITRILMVLMQISAILLSWVALSGPLDRRVDDRAEVA